MATATSQSATGNPYIDGLLGGTRWNTNFTFSFPQSTADYENGYGAELATFAAVTAHQRDAVRAMLTGQTVSGRTDVITAMSLATFIAIQVTEAGGLGNGMNGLGDIRIAQSEDANPTAFAYFPSSSGKGGDVWFGTSYAEYASPVAGSYGYHTHLHEIGHALGLKHSHEMGGVSNVSVPANRDSVEFTVMSYRSYVGGPSSGGYTYGEFSAPQTYMMYDILALQTMYGADFGAESNNTNTVYSWNPTTGTMYINGVAQGTPGGNKIFLTIWDGGGVDTYDMSNYSTDVVINLEPGNWSITSQQQRASLGSGKLANGTVYNALLYQDDLRSLIENAIGGSGNDTITGNQIANVLSGGLGNDTYYIGPGDTVVEQANEGTDTVFSSAASYALTANVENLTLTAAGNANGAGNDLANVLTGNGANNYLYGYGGNDTLNGGAGDDVLVGGAGADTMSGGTGNDTYDHNAGDIIIEEVNAGTDLVKSGAVSCTLTANVENLTLVATGAANGAGNSLGNTLTGNNAANYLYGFDGNDRLYGVAGDDVLIGGNGNDVIYGGAGKDTLVGGANADYFDFKNISESAVGANRDVITDFSHAQGDRINLAQIDANTSVAGDQAFTYIGSAAFTAAGQVRYANGIVEVNVDAGLGADMQIQLTGAPALVAGDFVL